MNRVKLKNTLNLNYNDLFEDWVKVLNPLLSSTYMFNLMAFLKEIYNILPNTIEGKGFIFPYENRVFDNFRSCPYDSLRCVVIGNEPYKNNSASGIPFGIPITTSEFYVEKQVETIESCIRRNLHDNDNKYIFDESMYSWTYQGVLLLNSALTSEEGTKMSHAAYWREFNRQVVKLISDNNEDIVFMLWGEEAQYFEKFIDRDKHHVLYHSHPQDAIDSKQEWNCPNFEQANKILTKLDGSIIYW